tara:strand:+ start:360 stop:1241 length:882 start_codon:yes stop_codon:yes gene_type:complete
MGNSQIGYNSCMRIRTAETTIVQGPAGNVVIGGSVPVIIAGPCVIETKGICLAVARAMKKVCDEVGIQYIFKASFDKANRSVGASYRGPGLKDGLEVLTAVREHVGCPVTTDIHLPEQADLASKSVDLIQIPAFLCRQTDILHAAGATGSPVSIKKGQFMSPDQMRPAANKVAGQGTGRVILIERGTFFGYGDLVVDMRSLMTMNDFHPVVFDVTHSCQTPGSGTLWTGGNTKFADGLARAAVASGWCSGIFMEVHSDPSLAKSDASTMLCVPAAERLIRRLAALWKVVGEWN